MLQVGLADFQFVHPTEMEVHTVRTQTNEFDVDKDGKYHQKYVDKSTPRRKRVALLGSIVIVKAKNMFGRMVETTFEFDATGRALCAVPQTALPQLPMDADYEVRLPNGHADHGKVRCGGNEQVLTTEVVARGS
jgi:hypothetical protein